MTRLMLVGFPLFFSNHQRLKYTGNMGSPRKNTEQFIAEAKAIHGDKYDYSKVSYINNSTKVSIVCSTHGDFCRHQAVILADKDVQSVNVKVVKKSYLA